MATRWRARAEYGADNGKVTTFTHDFDELSELEELIERGPPFDALIRIEVTYQLVQTSREEAPDA